MNSQAFQDKWPDMATYCWGCGRNNEHGLQIKSYWEGEEAICIWKPKEYHMAGGSIVCGGIISTIIDCHCLNTACAAVYKEEGREIGTKPFIPYVTGTIHVKLLQPTPIDEPVVLRAKIKEMKEKKIIVTCSLFSDEIERARGEIVAIRLPEVFWVKE